MDYSEEKYKVLVESAYDSILIVKNFNIVFANRKSFEMSGYLEEEVIGKPFSNFIANQDINKIKDSYIKRLENKVYQHKYRTQIITKNGSLKPVEISITTFNYEGEIAEMVIIKDISEQLAIEKEREEELILLKTLIDHIPSSIFVLDKKYRKTFFNDLHLSRVNCNLDDDKKLSYNDLIGKTNWEVYNKELADYYYIEDRKVIEDGYKVINRETQGIDQNGDKIWESISKIPIKDKNGEIIGLLGIANDITKNKLYEVEIKENEDRFRNAILYAPIPMAIFTCDNKIHQLSEGWINLSGYDMNDTPFITDWIKKSIPEAKQIEFNKGTVFTEITKKYLSGEKDIRCSDGTTRYWDFSTTLIGLTHDSKHLYLSTAIDLTERKIAEMKHLESRKQLESIFLAVDNILYLLKVEGDGLYRYVSLNKNFNSVTGLPEINLIGKLVSEVVPEPHLSLVLSKYKEAIEKKIRVSWEGTIKYPKGEKTGEVTIIPIFNEEGKCTNLVGSVNDITDRKMVEKEIIKINNNLENKIKERTLQLEASNHDLESFAYSVSHDLRSPLRHIEGFSALMKRNIPNMSEEAENYYHKIIDSVKKMNSMIEAILSFSRLGKKTLEITDINLNSLVEKIIDRYSLETANRIVEWKVGILPIIKGDEKLIELAFENLISNALKFSSGKKTAKIEISRIQKSNTHCIVCIKDNGVGFDMSYSDKLFKVFQRLHTEKEFEGTGIGLANVKQILSKHGWTIYADAKEGKGASFYINFIS